MKKAIIIHGTKGSPDGNWFRSVGASLEQENFQTIIPQFPTPEGQELGSWLTHFRSCVGETDERTVLIGHSVGAVFVLRLLETLSCPVSTAALVAGFTGVLGIPEYDRLNESFVTGPFKWDLIRRNAQHVICMSGSNDPYVPLAQGREIAEALGQPHVVVESGGHLNAESGFTSFSLLLDQLAQCGILERNLQVPSSP